MSNKVKFDELKNVTGGTVERTPVINCPGCAKYNEMTSGVVVNKEKTGCGTYKYYYKCVYCGHEWNSDYYNQ